MAPIKKAGRNRLGVLGLLLLVLVAPSLATGAEFSALMMVKDGAKAMPGKIYVQGGMMRQEFIDEGGQTITIARPDKKVVWVIIPREQAYMEMPLKTSLPGQFIQIPPQAVAKHLVGKERVNDYETDKVQVSVPGAAGVEIQTFWVSKKLGLPIKMECRTRHFSLEYQSIKEEKVPDRLFNLPPGYQKTSTAGFANKVEE
jgi:outer membrane lipoprotein-sorting protein